MSRELMQRALDALELHATQYPHMQKGYTVDAIDELRAFLAAPVAPAELISDWHACGMDYAYTEATDPSASDDWITDDIAKAFQAGARLAQRTASVGDKPATSEPVAWRWQPSQVFPAWSFTDNPARAQGVRDCELDVQPLYAAPPDVQRDAERLDWLLLNISGKEFRRIRVEYGGNACRADVDAAMSAKGAHAD